MDEVMTLADAVFQEKARRRLRLVHLSYPEKVRIVVELQKMQAPILAARGIHVRIWDIDCSGANDAPSS